MRARDAVQARVCRHAQRRLALPHPEQRALHARQQRVHVRHARSELADVGGAHCRKRAVALRRAQVRKQLRDGREDQRAVEEAARGTLRRGGRRQAVAPAHGASNRARDITRRVQKRYDQRFALEQAGRAPRAGPCEGRAPLSRAAPAALHEVEGERAANGRCAACTLVKRHRAR